MALRANYADGYKSWLTLGIKELGREVAAEVESEWMVLLLVEEERDRLIASLQDRFGCEPVTRLGDRSAAKPTWMGYLDRSAAEKLRRSRRDEGMTSTHFPNMKLSF